MRCRKPDDPKEKRKFRTLNFEGVSYRVDQTDDKVYLVHKDAEGKYDTLSRPPVAVMKPDDDGVKKKIYWSAGGFTQHVLAIAFLDKKVIKSAAELPDDTDLEHYQMSFFDCNHDTPILGEPFKIKMGGVLYEVTDEEFVSEAGGNEFLFVVKHAGVELPNLLFDHNPTREHQTKLQLVGVDSMGRPKKNSKEFRSGHIKRVKALTSPKKKKRAPQMKFAAGGSAGGSAVSLD